MNTTTLNVAFQKTLLRQIDEVAQAESRSRSEFLREAARAYIQRRQRWSNIFDAGQQVAEKEGLTLDDVAEEIAEYRKSGFTVCLSSSI